MCNWLHDEYREIPESGVGYKLFLNGKTLVIEDVDYQTDLDGWIRWKRNISINGHYRHCSGDGFCFFLSYREAEKALETWKMAIGYRPGVRNYEIKPIVYRKGLGEVDEIGFCGGETWNVALAKEFKVIDFC